MPGVALAAGAAAQLVVDAAGLVALGAEHEQAAGGEGLLLGVGDLRLDLGLAREAASGVTSTPMARCSWRQDSMRMSTLPPSWMSVPRPAMLVAMVTAPGLPASATISASCSW
jgi:hypothetical protein